MIDKSVLEELFAEFADEIPLPPTGADNIVEAMTAGGHPDARARQLPKLLAVAAAILAVGLIGVTVAHHTTSTNAVRADRPETASPLTGAGELTPAKARSIGGDTTTGAGNGAEFGKTVTQAGSVPVIHAPIASTANGRVAGGGTSGGSATAAAPAGTTDGAKIVKTGTLDLQVGHGALRVTVNRVTAAAVGLAGYVSDSKTNYGGSAPTALITIRVPVGNFETAIAHLDAIPGVKVLGESESGSDITGQYTDLQAQLSAATSERDALLQVLSHAQSTGDILAVRDRVSTVQTEINQLQGRINVLDNQASLSSLAVTVSEKPVKATATAAHHAPPTGLAKSWSDARQGFSNGVEWLIARSGGALIFLLAALALLFALRYLYPVVRRALV